MHSLHLEHDLFLLLLNLSQVTGEERIKTLFIDSMNSLSEHLQLKFVEKQEEVIGEAIEITTLQNNLGFIDMQSAPDQIDESTKALIRNSVRMLALFLEKQLHDRLLSDEKLLLNDLVAKQTQTLEASNNEMKQEIAARKQAEESLHKYEHIVSSSTDMLAFMDKQYTYLAANKEYVKAFDLTTEKLIGKTVGEVFGKKFFNSVIKPHADRCFGGEEVNFQSWFDFPSIGKRYMDITYYPYYADDKQILGFVVNGRNITDRKLVEERYKKTIESSIDGFWIVNTRGDLLEINAAYSKMIGYSRDELLKMSIMDIEAIEHSRETRERIEKIVKNGSDRFESKHRHKKGHIIDVEVSTIFIEDNGGLFYTFLRDITEKNQMEERLQQAQKMESIGNLAGGIAHDFNNLLFPIIGMSEMLLEDLPEDSLEYENAEEIFTAGKRAGNLVQQILAFSRQSEHKMTAVRVQSVLKEVLKLSRSTIPTNIEIHENIQQNCGLVMADSAQVHQISMNLITNAFHAVEEKNGTIDIELKEIDLEENEIPDSALKPGQYVRFSVSDNGTGISQNAIHKIFEPYFTTKEQGKGTGLGLAVVYGIVKEHKGEIKVYSEVGKGTTFNVYLPLMKKSSEIAIVDNVARAAIGTESILLVDDEVSVAKLEGQMLSRLGYQVTVKTNSRDALNAFRSNPDSFDLVISDMTMPDMTGDQLSKEILSLKPDTPIIICTGFSERINKEQAEVIGVKGFLMKPVVKLDMAQMVRKVLDEAKVFKEN